MGCIYSRVCIGDNCRGSSINGDPIARTTDVGEVANFSHTSSDVEEGEIRDQLNQLSITRDSEAGIRRLARVSAQFLPPDGSRIVKVPSGNFELRYSFLSQRGYYPDALDKANQDSFCIHTPFGTVFFFFFFFFFFEFGFSAVCGFGFGCLFWWSGYSVVLIACEGFYVDRYEP